MSLAKFGDLFDIVGYTMLFNFVGCLDFSIVLIRAPLMSLKQTKRASDAVNLGLVLLWYFCFYNYWVDAAAGGRFVPEGITSPVVSAFVMT